MEGGRGVTDSDSQVGGRGGGGGCLVVVVI